MAVVYSANAYGPGDSVDPQHSHVVPATIMKCLRDEDLVVWGDGTPTRDFLFVEDVAEGLLLAAERLQGGSVVNIGSGAELSIRELVQLIVELTGFRRRCVFDASQSGGDARRCVATVRAERLMGFRPRVPFRNGLERTIAWYRERLSVRTA
jgi:GDP-L-fucose synthase